MNSTGIVHIAYSIMFEFYEFSAIFIGQIVFSSFDFWFVLFHYRANVRPHLFLCVRNLYDIFPISIFSKISTRLSTVFFLFYLSAFSTFLISTFSPYEYTDDPVVTHCVYYILTYICILTRIEMDKESGQKSTKRNVKKFAKFLKLHQVATWDKTKK